MHFQIINCPTECLKILVALVSFVWKHRILSLFMGTNGTHFHRPTNQKQFTQIWVVTHH